jgi:signal transduction histidine kinase
MIASTPNSHKKNQSKECNISELNTRLLAIAEELAHFGSWEFDTSKPRAIWSSELFRIFGIQPKAEGLTWEEYTNFIHPDDIPNAVKNSEIMFNANINHKEDFDYRIIKPDGSIRIIHSKRQVREIAADGKTRIIVGVDQDVTEQKQAEDKIKAYSKHLEELVNERTKQLVTYERLAAIGQIAGMIGHDIRNPLQAIVNELYFAKQEMAERINKRDMQSALESLGIIQEQTDYISKIVSDLQDYARPLNPELQLINACETIGQSLKSVPIPNEIKTEVICEDSTPLLMLDPTLLKRILTNLVSNSIQAMPNGGKLTVQLSMEGNKALISVIDTGVGIAEEAKPKIFSPLFTTKAKGQGLGLAVVKRLVEALNGTIGFESKAGKGTKFTIRFPIEN